MPNFSFDISRRIGSQLALAILILGFASSTANAGLSSGLRDLVQGALSVDLRVDSIALDKGQASIGETLKATVGISNGGRAPATSTLLTLWARFGSATSTANAFRLATVRLGTLQPLTSITSVSTFPVPNFGRLGSYQIFATVESAAPEQDRKNNTKAKTLIVIGPAFSDTDYNPVSDSGASLSPPPAPAPVAGGGSSSPPAFESSGSSTPSAPTSDSGSGSGSSTPSGSSSGSGSSSPSGSTSGSSSPPAPVPTPPSFTCDYYASPNGRGNGTTPQMPFQVQNFWAVATPGTTLCLIDGHYTGAASMIAPQQQGQANGSPSGTPSQKITIRALNKGKVFIDGQFARNPVRFFGNSDIEVIGINACCGGGTRPVYLALNGAKRIAFREVIGWDQALTGGAGSPVGSIFSVNGDGVQDILFEDCAGFGLGQRMGRSAFRAARTTYRRCWFRHEGDPDTAIDPMNVFNLWRDSGTVTAENLLVTLDGSRAGSGPQFFGLIIKTGDLGCALSGSICAPATAKLLGSILYLKPGCCSQTGLPTSGLHWEVKSGELDNGTATLDHFVAYMPDHNFRPILASDSGSNFSGSANNVTSIKHPSAPASVFTNYSGTNRYEGAVVPNIYTGSTGAKVCQRYSNGILTDQPLWPWPMDQRIKEAIDIARAMQASPRSPLLTGGSVTAEIEALLGPIPPACRAS